MAILENWEQVSDAQEVAANSAGTSAQKYDIYLNSMQAHINQLKTVWSEFLMNLSQGSTFNTIIDAVQKFVSVLDTLINKTPIGTAVLIALGVALTHFTVAKAVSGIQAFVSAVSKINGLKNMGFLDALIKGFLQLAGVIPMTTTATIGATSAFAGLGTALATILPYIGIIAGIAAVVGVVAYAIDQLVVTDKELSESIANHEKNIESIDKTIDGYNETLDQNKQRIQEINDLKGTSAWSNDLQTEADSLERQNELLEQQIQLQEHKKALEEAEEFQDREEQFNRNFGDEMTYSSTDSQGITHDYKGVEAYEKKWKDNVIQVNKYKDAVAEADKKTQEATAAQGTDEFDKKDKAAKKAQKTADKYYDSAVKNETELTKEIEDKQEAYEYFTRQANDGNEKAKAMAATLKEELEYLYGLPTVTAGFDTIGEALGYTASAAQDTRSEAEKLRDEFVKLHDTEVKPKDADSMVSWLDSLSDTDFSHVQEVLMGCGDAADVLKEALNNLSGDQAAQLLTEAWKIYNGELDDANEKISTFQNSKKTDWNKQLSDVAEAYNYIKDYQKGTEVDYQTYKAALDLMGLSTEEVAANTDILTQKLAASKKYLGDDGTQRNYKTFLDDVTILSKDASKNMNDFGKKIVEVSTDSAGNTKMVVNDLHALGQELNLSDTEVQALLNGMKQFGDVQINPSTTLLQENLKDTYDKIDALQAKFREGFVSGDIKLSNLDAESASKTKEELTSIVNQANQIAMERYGITFDVKADGIEETESALTNLASKTQSVLSNYKTYFNEATGELNTDSVEQAVEKANGILKDKNIEGKITFDADTQSIEGLTSNTIAALNEALGGDTGLTSMVLTSLQGGFGEINWNEELKIADAESAIKRIQDNLNNIKAPETQAWAEAILSAAKGCGEGVEQQMTAALNKVAAVNGKSALLESINSQTGDVKGSIATVASALTALKGSADSAVQYVNAQLETIKLPSLSGSITQPATGVAPIGYATGGIYGKQDGKDPAGREHLTATQNYNAMVGEIGEELVVHRDGTSQVVGKKGAELVHLDKGDTVIPANVTSLIQQGKISGYPTGAGATLHGVSNQSGVTPTESRSSSSNKSSKSSGRLSSSSSSSKSSSDSSKSSSSGSNDAAENELKALEHQRKMEYITEKQYAQKYEAIWKKYYKDKKEYQDKDWEMQEKLHDLQKTFFEDRIAMLDEENNKLQRNTGTEQKQIANYQQMQQLYHDRAEQYRKQGFTDDSQEIRELSKSWWDMYDKINDLRTQMFDNYINDFDHTIDLIDSRMDRIDDYVIRITKDSAMTFDELEKDLGNYLDNKISLYKQKAIAINAQLVAVNTELNRLYKEGYEKNKENIQKLEKQAEELKNNVHDIAESIRQENLDNIQHELDYQERLRSAVKQYAQDQVDKIQDQIDKLEEENDALDKQKEKKKLLEALDSSKQRNKRVYYADKGWVNYMPIINYIG